METRLRMLNVTYMRYIDQHLICFIPGKVLDEMKRLLRLVESRFDPPSNNNQLLEELRDLSSMAMEHFDEHILPLLERREQASHYKNPIPSTSKPVNDSKTLKELKKLHKRNRLFKTQVSYLMSKSRRLSEKWNRQNLRIKKQSTVIKEQNAKLQVQATRLENHEMTISEMQKKFEELQNNFVEMKTNWDKDINTKPNVSDLLNKESLVDVNTVSKNLKNIMQQESVRQKHNVLKKLCNRNSSDSRTIMNKVQLARMQRDERRRKCISMVDMEIWRRHCPTSRSSYCLGYRNIMRNRSEILLSKNQNTNESYPSTSGTDKKAKNDSNFEHKSVIRQRASRIFPLTCLDLERKRKSPMCSHIPSKLSKNDANYSLKALDLINKYLPGPRKTKISEDENSDGNNIFSYLESQPVKRKREDVEDV